MFKRILLPLDGSELAEITLPYGEELARRLGSELILLYVRGQEHQKEYEHIHKIYLDRLAETMAVNISRGRPEGNKFKIATRVESGGVEESIFKLSDENDVDLIIMASVSSSGLKIGKTLGSVTGHICRTAPIPVMIIRPQNILPETKKQLINHILIPLDGSDLSNRALPVGGELASSLKVGVTLFQMADTIVSPMMVPDPEHAVIMQELNEVAKKRVNAEMVILEQELRKKCHEVSHVVTCGLDAAGHIIETCNKTGSDLVVMSTHGRSGLGRFALGSVAEKILRHIEVPLLLVNARSGFAH